MSLINCKECGKEVSTEAKSCPHCGALQPKKSNGPMILFFISIMIVGLIGDVLFFSSESPEEHQKRYSQAVAECSQIASKVGMDGLSATGSLDQTLTMQTAIDCLASRGFKVDPK